MLSLLLLLLIHNIEIGDGINYTLMNMDPLDVVEYRVVAGLACWFGGWDDQIEIEVDVDNGRGRSLTYGPYSNDDKVFGACVMERDFIIRFSNNSPFKQDIAVKCANNLNTANTSIYPGFDVASFDQEFYSNLSGLEEPMLFSNNKNSDYTSFTILISVLGSITIFIVIADTLFAGYFPDNINDGRGGSSKGCCGALSDLFSFGKNAGSFLGNVVSLFRIFQRVSATSTFKTKFSSDAESLFSWANDLFKIILNKLPVEHLTDFELFSTYSYGYTIFMIYFIFVVGFGPLPGVIIFPFVVCVGFLGAGFSLIGVDKTGAIIVIVMSLIFLIVLIILAIIDPCHLKQYFGFGATPFRIISSLVFGLLIICCVLSQYLLCKEELVFILSIISGAVFGLGLFVNFIALCTSLIPRILYMFFTLTLTISSLLVVPTCEIFVSVIESSIGPLWYVVLAFVFYNIIFPLALDVVLILSYDRDIITKYKCEAFFWFEVLDKLQKIIYAILASYDIPWACFGLQLVWMIVYIAFRPCKARSDNVLNIGESLVLMIVNIIVAVTSKSDTLFPFEVCVFFICFSCVPIIVASYTFFMCDFTMGGALSAEGSDDSFGFDMDSDDEGGSFTAVSILCMISAPIAVLIYGMNFEFLFRKVRIPI